LDPELRAACSLVSEIAVSAEAAATVVDATKRCLDATTAEIAAAERAMDILERNRAFQRERLLSCFADLRQRVNEIEAESLRFIDDGTDIQLGVLHDAATILERRHAALVASARGGGGDGTFAVLQAQHVLAAVERGGDYGCSRTAADRLRGKNEILHDDSSYFGGGDEFGIPPLQHPTAFDGTFVVPGLELDVSAATNAVEHALTRAEAKVKIEDLM
jgi:hypothetical protein